MIDVNHDENESCGRLLLGAFHMILAGSYNKKAVS
jgi:hypothetical protein